ncbi:oligosaccharide flippase family protein [Candidatus Roizmanbacteria bacterium]|nr:oligosaccharide flippase family protein [Candidatus Roizmanbacteria bacterium]
MKQRAQKLLKHPLIAGSIVIFFGTLFGNVFNFLYTAFMIRFLPPGDKGVLFALISIITLPSLAANAILPSILSFAGKYFANNEIGHVHGLYSKITKLYLCLGIVFFILFLVFIPSLSSFLKIANYQLLLLANIVIFVSFFNVINTGFLQAKLAFGYISFISILNAVLKFLAGVILVLIGFAVGGAVWAIVISVFIPYFLSFIPIRFVFDRKIVKEKVNTKELIVYGLPSALAMLGLTSFITSDILLVKHFFHPLQVDFYAGLSVIGRVIFYFSAPIALVMFPLIVQKNSKGENSNGIFLLSIFLVLIPSIAITIMYFLIPDFIMGIFGVKNLYILNKNLLGMFGLFITTYAVASVLVNFYLSIKKTMVYIPILIAALAQIVGIWFYHNSFLSVVTVSLVTTLLLAIILLLYYPYATKKQ